MTEYPINYTFVKRKKLELTEDNGEVNTYTVLVLDDDLNTNYFKKIESLKKTVQKVGDNQSPDSWLISQSFIDLAIDDMLREEFMTNLKEAEDPNSLVPTLLGIKVKPLDNDEAICILRLTDGLEIKNIDW